MGSGPLDAFGPLATTTNIATSQGQQSDAPKVDLSTMTDLQVLDVIGDKLKTSIVNDIDLEVEPERFLQVMQALKLSYYWQAKQYLRLAPRGDESLGFFPMGLGTSTELSSYAAFRYVYNIFRADGLKFVAVLGQRAPHVQAVPDDTEDEQSVGRATQANAVIDWLHDQWNADRTQKDIARHYWRTATCFLHTYYNADGGKYGWMEVPDIQVETKEFGAYRCPNCGQVNDEDSIENNTCPDCGAPLAGAPRMSMNMDVPVNKGMKKVPRGCVEAQLRTIFEVSWPAEAKSISECVWLCEEIDLHKAKALALYASNAGKPGSDNDQKIADIINSDSDSDMTSGKQAAADARAMLLSMTSTRVKNKNMLRHSAYWIRPEWFDLLRVQGLDSDVVAQLWDRYPRGIRVIQLRGQIIKIDGASMDDEWAAFKGGTDEKMLCDAAGYDVVPTQDNINHMGNMMTETVLRGIPRTFVPAELMDRASIEQNEPMPGEMVPYRMNSVPGGNIGNVIAKIPTAEMSQQTMPFMEWLREYSRDADGAQPAISGGGPASTTFRSDLLRRNQALMQWQPFFDEMQSGWEVAYQNGVKQWAMYSSDVMRVPGGQIENGSEVVDPQELLKAGYHCEADEQIPISQAEEAQQLLEMIEQTPALAGALEITSDQNVDRLSQIYNMRGFISRKVQEKEKFQWYLDKLMKSGPLPALPTVPGAPPAFPQPSIPADSFEDDHAFMAQCARDFLNSKPGLKLKAISMGFAPPRPGVDPKAYDNILAFGRAHQAQVPPPLPGPAPGPAPPKPRVGGPARPPAALGPGAPPATGRKMDVMAQGRAAPPPNVAVPQTPTVQ